METRTDSSVLASCRQALSSQRDYMIALQAEWYIQILFAHGVQNANYDVSSGQVLLSGLSGEMPWWPGYNVIDAVINRMKSVLMASPPKRDVKSIRPTERSINEARLASLVTDWAYENFNIEEKEQVAADWFVKTGNVVPSFYYDPTQGEEIGDGIFTGKLVPRIDSPMRWFFDPRASTWDEVRFAIRRTIQPIEWCEEHFPDAEDALRGMQTSITEDDFFERRLLNLTQITRNPSYGLPLEKKCVTVFEYYEIPCSKYPNGRHAILAGSGGTPKIVLRDYGQNPYKEIPAVLITLSKFSGRLWGETPVKFLLPPQREINRRRRQIIKNCDKIGNPIIKYPIRGGTPPGMITNSVGQILPYDPEAGSGPDFMSPPVLPPFVLESERSALDMIAYIAPISPADRNAIDQATSGIQLQLAEEIQRRSVMPMMRNWELGWDAFWKKYLRLFRRFTIYPQQIQAVGPEAQVLSDYVSGDMISENVTIKVVPYSSLPTSRTAAFAEWSEMFKFGAASPNDPLTMKRFWEDIGKGDMARTYRDMQSDMELAERNLLRIQSGEPVYPRVQDNPDVHLMKFQDFMKTAEYEAQLGVDPGLESRMMMAIRLFGMAKEQQELAIIKDAAMLQMRAAMMTGGVPLPPQMAPEPGKAPKKSAAGAVGQAENIRAGNPAGGKEPNRSAGYGKAMNPYADQGGNPG